MPRRRGTGQKAPATPAPGSSPISPPGGSGRRPSTAGRAPPPRVPRPPGLASYAVARPQVMQARQVDAARAPRRVITPLDVAGQATTPMGLYEQYGPQAFQPLPTGPPGRGPLSAAAGALLPGPAAVVQAAGNFLRPPVQYQGGPFGNWMTKTATQADVERARATGGLPGLGANLFGPLAINLAERVAAVSTPVTQTEEQQRLGLNPAGNVYGPERVLRPVTAGQAPPLGLKLERSIAQGLGSVLDVLQEPFLQTTGRLAAASTTLSKKYPRLGNTLPDLSRPFWEVSLDNLGYNGFGKPVTASPDAGGPLPNWREAWQAIVEGRTNIEQVHPINQMLLGLALDPLILVSQLTQARRFQDLASEAFRFSQVGSALKPAETAALIRSGNLFETSRIKQGLGQLPVVGKLFQRMPESVASLTAETAMTTLDSWVRVGQTADEKLELMQMFVKAATGDESWRVTADAYGLLRTAGPRDAARLKELGLTTGSIISPVTSSAGQVTGLVLQKVIGTGGARRQVAKLIETIDAGYRPGVAKAVTQAADGAARNLLGRFLRASEELAGVTRTDTALDKAGRYWAAYQGAYARLQLGSFGRVGRDALASVTDGITDGVLGNFEPGFFKNTWRGFVPSATRAVAAESIGRVGGEKNLLMKAVNLPARFKQAQEDVFAQMAIKRGIDWVFGKVWRGQDILPAEMVATIRQAIGAEASERFFGGITASWDPTDIDRAVKNILGNETWRNLSPQWATKFRAYSVDGQVGRTLDAADAPAFKQAVTDLEVKLRRGVNAAQPYTSPAQDAFEQAYREALARSGMAQSEIDDIARLELPKREAAREPKVLAQAMARDAVDSIPDEAARGAQQEAWLTLKQELDLKQNQAAGRMVGELRAAKLQGPEAMLAQMEANSAEWSRLFREEIDAWHNFREGVEQVHVPADMRIPPDVARETTALPTQPVQPPPTQPTGTGIPTMITQRMRQSLRDQGYTSAQIDGMTPIEAHTILQGAARQAPPTQPVQPLPTQPAIDLTDQAVRQTRHNLPDDMSRAMEQTARQMLTDLNQGAPGERVFIDYGIDRQVLGQPSTYPSWYSDLVERFKVRRAGCAN